VQINAIKKLETSTISEDHHLFVNAEIIGEPNISRKPIMAIDPGLLSSKAVPIGHPLAWEQPS